MPTLNESREKAEFWSQQFVEEVIEYAREEYDSVEEETLEDATEDLVDEPVYEAFEQAVTSYAVELIPEAYAAEMVSEADEDAEEIRNLLGPVMQDLMSDVDYQSIRGNTR